MERCDAPLLVVGFDELEMAEVADRAAEAAAKL